MINDQEKNVFINFSSTHDEAKLTALDGMGYKSKSFASKTYGFKSKADILPKPKADILPKSKSDGRQNFSIIKTLFQNNKDRKRNLVKKIDQFADEKASHFISMRKLKKKDPFSDNFEVTQARSQSRTFTSGKNMIKNKVMQTSRPSLSLTLIEPIFHRSQRVEEVKQSNSFNEINDEEKVEELQITNS
jgi:hypothetical protein